MSTHEKFMQLAIDEAEKGQGKVSPNPLVGAVLVKSNKVISKGHHKGFGKAHAEVEALAGIDPKVKADLYVTLEPCAHHGKTPPCVDLILKYKKLKNIFIGIKDPNPQVKGKSLKSLKENGFKIQTGILAKEIKRQNEVYLNFINTKKPFVTLKGGMTLDGKIATKLGDSKWITSTQSRKAAHKLRAKNDAVLVGIGTVLADNPLLVPKDIKKSFRSPVRIIIDPNLKTPLDCKIAKTAKTFATIIYCSRFCDKAKQQELEKKSIKVVNFPCKNKRFSILEVLQDLGRRNIASVLVEGGSKTNASFWEANAVNKLAVFIAPKIFGGDKLPFIGGEGIQSLSDARKIKITKSEQIGSDVFIEAYIND